MTNNVSLTTITWLHCLGLLLHVLVVLGLNATLKFIRPSLSSSSSSTLSLSHSWYQVLGLGHEIKVLFTSWMTVAMRACRAWGVTVQCRSSSVDNWCHHWHLGSLQLSARRSLSTILPVSGVLYIASQQFPSWCWFLWVEDPNIMADYCYHIFSSNLYG